MLFPFKVHIYYNLLILASRMCDDTKKTTVPLGENIMIDE